MTQNTEKIREILADAKAMPTADEVYGKGYNVGHSEGVEQGKQAEYNSFWDAYQDNGNRTNYKRAFSGAYWNDITYNPKYPVNATARTGGEELFISSNITDTKVDVLANNNFSSYLFAACSLLKTIRKLVVDENTVFPRWFDSCNSLENITIEGTIAANIDIHWSPLTHDSLMSIINALMDYSGSETTYTCTLGATNLAKLTDAEKTIATEKGWTLV